MPVERWSGCRRRGRRMFKPRQAWQTVNAERYKTTILVCDPALSRKRVYFTQGLIAHQYLQREYIDIIVPDENAVIAEYIDTQEIRDPLMLSRLHTVNLVPSDPF
jgi:hypothetical protein